MAKVPEASTRADPQPGSMLFQRLPQEMRDHIYSYVFSSTRFTFGYRRTSPPSTLYIKPAPNGLSLLRACRRSKLEIGDSWISRVLFNFEDPLTMMDEMTAFPADILAKICHVRLCDDSFSLCRHTLRHVSSRLGALLTLLPLRLDQFIVMSSVSSEVINYGRLNGLVRAGNGWKTLCYLFCGSYMLGFRSQPLQYEWELNSRDCWRKPQPRDWQSALEGRDGRDSSPSVTIYRATQPRHGSSVQVLDPKKRVRYEQTPREDLDSPNGIFAADPELVAEGERDKELMVVVRRGSGVDYEQKMDSPLLEHDIRRELPGLSWPQIRAMCIDRAHGERHRMEKDIQVDVYNDAYDFVWPEV